MCALDVSLSLSPRLSPIQALGLEKTWHDHSHDSTGVSGYASQTRDSWLVHLLKHFFRLLEWGTDLYERWPVGRVALWLAALARFNLHNFRAASCGGDFPGHQGPAPLRAPTVAPRNYKPQWTAEDFSRVGPDGVNAAWDLLRLLRCWSWLNLDYSYEIALTAASCFSIISIHMYAWLIFWWLEAVWNSNYGSFFSSELQAPANTTYSEVCFESSFRNACVGREVEVPWFFISGASEVPDVSVAAGAGALCGEGLEVRDETTSVVGRRALIPSRRAIAGGQAALVWTWEKN